MFVAVKTFGFVLFTDPDTANQIHYLKNGQGRKECHSSYGQYTGQLSKK